MYSSTPTRVKACAATRASAATRTGWRPPILNRLFGCRRGEWISVLEDRWERIANLQIGGRRGQVLDFKPNGTYRSVKLRAPSADVQIRRLTLRFVNGSLQDLSIGTVYRGCESRPIGTVARDLSGIALEYEPRAGAQGRVEVWACH